MIGGNPGTVKLTRHAAGPVLVVAAAMALGSCSTVVLPGSGTEPRYHFGLTKIVSRGSENNQRIGLRQIHTLGLRIGPGFGVGYFADDEFDIPLDCRIVVIPRDEAAMADIGELIERLKEVQQLCVELPVATR